MYITVISLIVFAFVNKNKFLLVLNDEQKFIFIKNKYHRLLFEVIDTLYHLFKLKCNFFNNFILNKKNYL
jgi:hypothetical protein